MDPLSRGLVLWRLPAEVVLPSSRCQAHGSRGGREGYG